MDLQIWANSAHSDVLLRPVRYKVEQGQQDGPSTEYRQEASTHQGKRPRYQISFCTAIRRFICAFILIASSGTASECTASRSFGTQADQNSVISTSQPFGTCRSQDREIGSSSFRNAGQLAKIRARDQTILATEHAKCVEFSAKLEHELDALKAEHQKLLTQQFETPAMQTPAEPAGLPMPAWNHQMLMQLQNMISTLIPGTHNQPGTYTTAQVPMDTEYKVPTAVPDLHQTPMPSLHPYVQTRVQSDVQNVGVGSHVGMHMPAHASPNMFAHSPMLPIAQTDPMQQMPPQMAPGSWQWPPSAPCLQTLQLPQTTIQEATATAAQTTGFVAQPADGQPVGPIQMPKMELPQIPSTEAEADEQHAAQHTTAAEQQLAKLATEAYQGLLEMQNTNEGTNSISLNNANQQKLIAFIQQQQIVQQQMQEFQQEVEPPKTPSAQPAQVAQSPQLTPAAPADVMSVNSTPQRGIERMSAMSPNAQVFSLSPKGQRHAKIPKIQPGHVHMQTNGVMTPVEDSDDAKWSPTRRLSTQVGRSWTHWDSDEGRALGSSSSQDTLS